MLDASALVRAFAYDHPTAVSWLQRVAGAELRAAWPSHLYAEVANAVLRLARAKRIARSLAEDTIAQARAVNAIVFPIEQSVVEALGMAFDRGLTVYDAAYIVLAEALGAPLVTADRRLAEATEQAVLLPE